MDCRTFRSATGRASGTACPGALRSVPFPPPTSSSADAGDPLHAADQPFHLLLRRIAGASRPDETLGSDPEALDDGLRVEIAVRDEDPFAGEGSRRCTRWYAAHRERQCRRPALPGGAPIERDAGDVLELPPQTFEKRRAPRVQDLEGRTEPAPPVGAARERRQKIHRGGGSRDALVVEGACLEPGRGLVGRGVELRNVDHSVDIAAHGYGTEVRAVELVRLAGKEIRA